MSQVSSGPTHVFSPLEDVAFFGLGKIHVRLLFHTPDMHTNLAIVVDTLTFQ